MTEVPREYKVNGPEEPEKPISNLKRKWAVGLSAILLHENAELRIDGATLDEDMRIELANILEVVAEGMPGGVGNPDKDHLIFGGHFGWAIMAEAARRYYKFQGRRDYKSKAWAAVADKVGDVTPATVSKYIAKSTPAARALLDNLESQQSPTDFAELCRTYFW